MSQSSFYNSWPWTGNSELLRLTASEKRKGLATRAEFDALFAEYERDWLPQQGAALTKIRAWLGTGEHVALTCFELEASQCHRHCVVEALAIAATHL